MSVIPGIKQILQLYGVRALKELSQNFLLNPVITDRIVQSLPGNLQTASVIEVGPGPGGLTQSLLKANCKRVIGVEKDTRFTPILQLLEQSVGSNRLSVAYEDMLRVDEQSLVMDASTTDLIPVTPWSGDDSKDTLQVVGNLPFSVATELLLKWLHQLPERKGVFHWGRVPFTLMFQSEVADRIVASPGTKAYGRLSVMTQQSCDARIVQVVRGSSFVPPPKVDASVVSIVPRVQAVPLIIAGVESLRSLEIILREVFGMRRKMLRRAIKPVEEKLEVDLLAKAGVNGSLRPEELTVAEWCRLADVFHDANRHKIVT